MIIIEVTKSSFLDAIGVYEYQFDEIYIGRSKKADVIFNDPQIPNKFLTIKIKSDSLVVFNELDSIHYFVNTKKLNGQRKLFINDCIQFGPHEIKILKYENTNKPKAEKINLPELLDKFNKENPEQKFLLNFLEEEILRLENLDRDKNV